ncbi:Acyl-CoA dehydrogenase [Haloechinothrix alba]|uniref:Acyl-CoA dehydrogenase n=1 Tax=Haloechinothrix alba TaxID=664784 RepID=A0A238XE28_9PSEU|nr:acyl-CoA dehydrogenase family protein [Haloechinothrix alba]SNR57275.1 Acyl-CoA dehydrogenase [Haloechinothrix alba]
MPLAITDTQQALASSVRDWTARTGPIAAVRAAEGHGVTPDSSGSGWHDLAAIGVLGIAVRSDLGGAGGTVTDAAAALEEAAAGLAPGPVLPTALAALVLDRARGPAATKEVTPQLAAGEAHAGVALEPFGVTARRADGGGLVVSGEAGIVFGADAGAHLVLSADVGGVPTWFVLAPGRDGVAVRPCTPVDFSRTAARVRLDEVEVPADAVLDTLSTEHVRDIAATLVSAEASGIARWCVRTASEYATTREQFGRPIGAFQAVKHLCATALCRAEQATALAWDAARAAEAATDQAGEQSVADQHAFATAAAAAYAPDAAVDNAKDCIQVLGGIGFTWEHDAHLYLRRALALRRMLGGTASWRGRLAGLAGDGHRRGVTLEEAEWDAGAEEMAEQRARVREVVSGIAALPPDRRRDELVDSGYLVPHWPRPYGLDASPALQLVIDEELERAGVARPELVIGAWAAPTILAHGTERQAERFVGPTLRGEITWCQLFSEPGAGSDLASLRTTATRVAGGWVLNGQKVWTSVAHEADWAICLARTDPEAPKHKGITYFLVDMRSDGIETRPLREITGDSRFNEVFLTEVSVPDDAVVGEPGQGWKLARTTLANERVAMSGGPSLGDGLEQLVARRDGMSDDELGGLVAQGHACSVLDARATLRSLGGHGGGAESSVRKLVGVWHRQAVAEAALGELGTEGAVVTEDGEEVVHEFLLSRCLSIAGGTTQVLLNVAAERLLGLPRD